MADINTQDFKFMDLIFSGLDHGIHSMNDGIGLLVPFLLTQIDGKKDLERFLTEEYEEGIRLAELSLKNLNPKPDFAVIVFDGYINWKEKKYDALFLRAFDKTQDEGFELCQRYITKKDKNDIELIGSTIFIGKLTTNYLYSASVGHSIPLDKNKKTWWKF